VSDRIDRYRLS